MASSKPGSRLLWAFIVPAVLCLALVSCQSIDNPKPYAKGMQAKTANIKPGSITGQDAKNRDYKMETKKGEADLRLSGNSRNFLTNAQTGRASAKTAAGKDAVITKIGTGGGYETAKNRGNMKTSVSGSDKLVNLDSNARTKLDVKDSGNHKDMTATGAKRVYEADPNDNDFKQGKLKIDAKPFDYTIDKGATGKSQASLTDNSQKSIFLGPKKWNCVSQTDSVTNCANEWGQKVGEVRGRKEGDVTLTNNLGIPIYTGKVVQDKTTGKKTAQINGGLFNAETAKQTDSNCPGFSNNKITLSKSITFKMANQRTVDGATRWDWPACFEASIGITLATGILGKNLAMKWIALVLPAGQLKCQDPATIACNSPPGQCLYCDMCDPVKQAKVAIMGNARSNICEAKGPQSFTASCTVCPPPEANMVDYCDRMSKGLGDAYWAKKANIDVTFEVYNRKTDQDFATLKADRLKYNQLVADYKKANIKAQFSFAPVPDADLSNWYKMAQAEKIGCRQSLINYNLAGSKMDASILFEGAAVMGVLDKNPCPPPKG